MPSPSGPVATARARVARLHQDHASDDPAVIAAKRELDAAKLADHVAKVVDGWPPLTSEQLDHIAALLRAGGRSR